MPVSLKSAYAEPAPDDGWRCLVDRLWPRGLTRESLQLDEWQKDLAPSDQLRRWFQHDPAKWPEFQRRYFAELDDCEDAVAGLLARIEEGRVTLVFAARDQQHNNAVALRNYLERKLKPWPRKDDRGPET